MTLEPLLAPFTDKGKEASTGLVLSRTGTNNRIGGDSRDQWRAVLQPCIQHQLYCVWPPEVIRQKSCDHCAAQKLLCAVEGVRVSNRKRRDKVGNWGIATPEEKPGGGGIRGRVLSGVG